MNIFVEKLQSPDFPILFTKKDLKKLAFEKDVLDDLFNEAIIKSFVVNVYKGIYTLERMYRRTLLENGVLAQKIIPYSYVTTYSVLGDEGWIPEAVCKVTSITNGNSIVIDTGKFGSFRYDKIFDNIPTAGIFLKKTDQGEYKRASPLRAICDYMYMFNKDWKGMKALSTNLRIHYEDLENLKKDDFECLQGQLGIKNLEVFLSNLRKELKL